MQAVVTGIVSPQWHNGVNATVLHESDNRLSFTFVVRTKAKDVVTGNGERGGSAALADNENIVSVCEGLNHRDLGACLRADDNLHSAFIEVLDRRQRFQRILLRIANK